jgi:hypothetical protein
MNPLTTSQPSQVACQVASTTCAPVAHRSGPVALLLEETPLVHQRYFQPSRRGSA